MCEYIYDPVNLIIPNSISYPGFLGWFCIILYIYITSVSYVLKYLRSGICSWQNQEANKEYNFSLQRLFLENISSGVVVLRRRFSVVRSGSSLSLKKNCYLFLQRICFPQNASTFTFARAQDNGMLILGWLCFDL